MSTELSKDCTNLGSMAPSNQADLQLLPSFKASSHFHQARPKAPQRRKMHHRNRHEGGTKIRKLGGQHLLFVSRENKSSDLVNKCVDVYVSNALKLTYKHL